MQDILVNDTWALGHQIGYGGYGFVYTATDVRNGGEVAVKMTDMAKHQPAEPGALNLEAEALRGVAGTTRGGKTGIPRAYWHGEQDDYYAMTTDVLGPSLLDLLNYVDGDGFSLKTVLLIADQAISRIQTIHNAGWLHRDIKPENMLMGVGRQGNTVFMIDMGLAKTHEAAEVVQAQLPPNGVPEHGTDIFMSLRTHAGLECSYGDDLEVLLYSLIFLRMGRLPWCPVPPATTRTRMEYGDDKLNMELEDICAGCPVEFQTILKYVRGLGFGVKPDYSYLRKLIRYRFRKEGYKYDNVYDWTEKLYRDTYPDAAGGSGAGSAGVSGSV